MYTPCTYHVHTRLWFSTMYIHVYDNCLYHVHTSIYISRYVRTCLSMVHTIALSEDGTYMVQNIFIAPSHPTRRLPTCYAHTTRAEALLLPPWGVTGKGDLPWPRGDVPSLSKGLTCSARLGSDLWVTWVVLWSTGGPPSRSLKRPSSDRATDDPDFARAAWIQLHANARFASGSSRLVRSGQWS